VAINITAESEGTNLGQISETINPEILVKPVFEYISEQFKTYSDSIGTELQLPNCYLETSFNPNEHPEFEGLVFFNTNTLSIKPEAPDRRRYFTDFNFFRSNDGESDPVANDLAGDTTRFENIVLTSYSPFYLNGSSVGKVFPNKINIKISNLGTTPINVGNNFKKFLRENKYMYKFVADMIQGASPLKGRGVLLNNEPTTINYYDLWDYFEALEIDEDWFDNHVALIRPEEKEIDVQDYNFQTYLKTFNYNGEIVFVRINKTGEGINQNFWVYPNSEGIVDFCDTQVKIEKDYTYKAFAYVLMIENLDDGGISVDPSDAEQPRLYEIPISDEIVVKVMQPPHPRPQVEFKNIKNKKDKIKVMLNLSSNEYKSLKYRGVSQSEEEDFDLNYAKYDPFSTRDSCFQYETERGKFQIFKMERHPTGYYDIGSNASSFNVESDKSTMTHFQDTIEPFKDYYYMIRSFNTYGYYSNPSPIYKVHMTKDANDTFLHVETVDFHVSDQNKHMLEKTMAKLLQVVPSSYQTTLVTPEEFGGYGQETNPNNLPDLGLVNIQPIWDTNTKFKLRLVSRKTGKKIDINLNFKLTKQITQNTE
tara:strand:- start:3732 stop:5507 length:1776 start_codon:yes stop_codon:yes gene_type:complete